MYNLIYLCKKFKNYQTKIMLYKKIKGYLKKLSIKKYTHTHIYIYTHEDMSNNFTNEKGGN